jgi:hypothetical protein
MGGSSNTVLHMLAIAKEAKIPRMSFAYSIRLAPVSFMSFNSIMTMETIDLGELKASICLHSSDTTCLNNDKFSSPVCLNSKSMSTKSDL